MQLSSCLLFAICLQASATTWSQTVSFTGKDVPLKTVFASVKKQTGFGFFYENGEAMLQSTKPVTLDLKNVSIDFLLTICLRNQPLDFSIEGTTIFIRKKDEHPPTNASGPASQPIPELKGRVTNEKGEPLVNANITVKRTGNGTVTDANGEFVLRAVEPSDIINVSFVGYKSQVLSVKNRSSLIVILDPASNDLDKVVVQAYGTTTQRLATGNIGVVRAEDIAKQPVMNVLEAVQGQIPGVVVTNTSGYASGSIKVEIRGRNTINGVFTTDPLYIIDGVPLSIESISGLDSYSGGSQGMIQTGITSPANGQSPLFSINPADIESVNILKDADATAIYGSRGANGVILITTKKGKAGKTHLELSAYQGYSEVDRRYNFLNTSQYVEMREEALKNDGLSVNINTAPDLIVGDTTRYVNWQKNIFGMGKTTDAEASLTGGDTRTTFRLGAGYHRQTEILTANGNNQRGSLSFNVNHKTSDQRFNMMLTGLYSIVAVNAINTPNAVNLAPNAPPIYDSMGKGNFAQWDAFAGAIGAYPFGVLFCSYISKANLLNSSLMLSYQVLKGLEIKTDLGYNNASTNQTNLIPIASIDPAFSPTGSSQFGNTQSHNIIFEPQIKYNTVLGKGKLNALAGSSIQNNVTNTLYLGANGYTNDAQLTSASAAPYQYATNNSGEFKYQAIFARITYNWLDKYIVNLNGRRDGDTRFAPGRQFGNFSSVGAAWIFSEEEWAKKNFSFLSFGKLRSSYGTTGSDQIADYQYLSRWQYGISPYNGSIPLFPEGHTDSLIHWQTNTKLELALDLGILKDNINLEAVWYRDRCNDQLISMPTPVFSGFGIVTTNSPANVQNAGWEFVLNSKIIDNREFKFSAKFNIGLLRNKLLSYPNFSQSPYVGSLRIGQSLNLARKLHYIGVDPQTGLYLFQDRNHDGQITYDQSGRTTDDSYSIDITPKYDGGFTANFSYKSLQLSVFFYFKKQLGSNAFSLLDAPGDNTNQPIEVLNRWQKPGDIASFAKFTTQPGPSFQYYQAESDATITDASFIRLQNLALSYEFPQPVVKPAGVNNLKLYIKAQNLFVITKYKDADPEIQQFGGLPIARVITAGITCNF